MTSEPATAEGAPHRVVLRNAAVSCTTYIGHEYVTITGILGPEGFRAPFTPDYQRGVMEGQKQADLKACLRIKGKGIPDDIKLNLDGTFQELPGGDIVLTGPLAIIDGLQRLTAGRALLDEKEASHSLRTTVYVDMPEPIQATLFEQINHDQTRVATNVLLRNRANTPVMESLRFLTSADDEFVLYGRVQWGQRRREGELITSHMLHQIAGVLHGMTIKSDLDELTKELGEIAARIGTEKLAKNVKYFFATINECFPFPPPTTTKRGFESRLGFLLGIALLFARHQDFWNKRDPDELFVAVDNRKKLATIDTDLVKTNLGTSRAPLNIYNLAFLTINRQRGEANRLKPRERPGLSD